MGGMTEIAVLSTLWQRTLPFYEQLCGSRWNAHECLVEAWYNLDLAFLAGVWRYSHAVGIELFPCGVLVWPPPDNFFSWLS